LPAGSVRVRSGDGWFGPSSTSMRTPFDRSAGDAAAATSAALRREKNGSDGR